ncbi:MAG: aspartyl-tRNA(Asn)/glutamyl-tRNA(Gln) amidotransferase subunit [Patescibacteria group bacterium]|jgi:aspartyl-tRNA(Asn)/glutamyl-tRNA(Gln) amidotransferase subunit B|nr:aspartyl-tRNA(Asn)/glutamyl-tRNA(Gln) amidotransferase subunit [Patescibacteria group bacterium]
MNKYQPTIGIEIHTQLATKSKMFCGCDNASVDAEPNTNICPVCLALPGSLPVINKGAVELAIIMGLGFNAKIAKHTSFDRKNYFYPDSPKGYQITQMDEPIIQEGYVEILIDGEFKRIGIHHAHLEEDAGKSTHPAGADYTLVDFNRAGTPLVEIVSDPDMHSPIEAKRYLQEVYAIVTRLGVTHGDLQHGNFKFDLNVSISSDSKLGTRTELKNLNSFRNAERALTYEIQRQIEVLESGQKVEQETRGFDDTKGVTFSQRGKEFAHDYRYFPEPDLPPLVLTDSFIKSSQAHIKDIKLPIDIRKQLIDAGLSEKEQDILISQPTTCDIYLDAVQKTKNAKSHKQVLNFLIGDYQAWLSDNLSVESKLTGNNLAELINQIDSGAISSKTAKDIFPEVILGNSPDKIIKDQGITQISDDSELENIIKEIITNNPKAVADYKSGNEKALGFFVGQVMAATKGQANPGKTNQLVLKLLGDN